MYEVVAKSYQQANYLTADPLRLVLMCYDGAISQLKKARDSYEKKDYLAKGLALKKAMEIIYELNASLDMKRGGEVAEHLRSLYTYMTQALTEADLKKDLELFAAVIRMLEDLAEGWRSLGVHRPQEASPALAPVPGAGRPMAASRAWSVCAMNDRCREIRDLLQKKLKGYEDYLSSTLLLKRALEGDDMVMVVGSIQRRKDLIRLIDAVDQKVAKRRRALTTDEASELSRSLAKVTAALNVKLRCLKEADQACASLAQEGYEALGQQLGRYQRQKEGLRGYILPTRRTPKFLNLET
jgi:flagellar protein FliS